MKKVRDKWWIQNTIYYLIKWADWSSEYNFYKLVNHLVDVLKVIINYEWKFKHKHKKISQINVDEVLNSENALRKQASRWDHMLYSVHSVLNETSKSHVFHFICSRISADFLGWIILHLISVSYSFYFQLQLACWAVESCCVKSERHFNENWY